MRVLVVGVMAVVIGVAAGALLAGSRVKGERLAEMAQAAADSAAAAQAAVPVDTHDTRPESQDPGHDGDEAVTFASMDGDTTSGDWADQQAAEAVARGLAEQRTRDSIAAVAEAEAAAAERAAELAAQEREEGARKLAKIFGAMNATDAAAVLQEMADHEIEMILMQMSDRLAAQILGVFEPGRAAALTRVVLGSARTGS